MVDVACPACGERLRLEGSRQDDGTIALRCLACEAAWTRDPTLRCVGCGSDDLRYTPKPLWERGRGDQRTPAGRIDAYACNACRRTDATRG